MSEPSREEDNRIGDAGELDLTVLIPVSERYQRVEDVFNAHLELISALGMSFEVIFVVDGEFAIAADRLGGIAQRHHNVRVVSLNRWFGEATALAIGFDLARGRTVMTLPSYFQVEPDEIPGLIRRFQDGDDDLLVAWRHPRIDAGVNRVQSWAFHRLIRAMTGSRLHDVSCGVRIMKRAVAKEIPVYGDLHRFFPLLALQFGFRVDEVPLKQSAHDAPRRIYRPGRYFRRLLDLLTLFFIFKFTKKPLRFFGLIGGAAFALGAGTTLYLGIYRLLSLGPIAGRPLLILGVLLMVLGLQMFSLGLLGEIIIFTHARHIRDYRLQALEE